MMSVLFSFALKSWVAFKSSRKKTGKHFEKHWTCKLLLCLTVCLLVNMWWSSDVCARDWSFRLVDFLCIPLEVLSMSCLFYAIAFHLSCVFISMVAMTWNAQSKPTAIVKLTKRK